MKSTISKAILLVLGTLLLNSCIIKSLFPFYTKDTICFEKSLLGTWKDDDKGKWNIVSFQDQFLKDHGKHSKESDLSREDLEIYNKFKDGYYITYTEKNNKTLFIGMPFKIEEQLFIDFSILEIENLDISLLTAFHIIPVHSFAKLDILPNQSVSIKWFDEDKMKNLLKSNKIRIKHERAGFDNGYLLTASSNELQKFIKKLMTSNIKNEWISDIELHLKKVNVKS